MGALEKLTLYNTEYVWNHNIIQFDVPVLSVYTNNGRCFLLSCLDINELQYLFFEIDIQILISLLKDQITIKEAYESPWYYNLYFDFSFDVSQIERINFEDLSDDYRPETGDILGLKELKEVKEYVIELEALKNKKITGEISYLKSFVANREQEISNLYKNESTFETKKKYRRDIDFQIDKSSLSPSDITIKNLGSTLEILFHSLTTGIVESRPDKYRTSHQEASEISVFSTTVSDAI